MAFLPGPGPCGELGFPCVFGVVFAEECAGEEEPPGFPPPGVGAVEEERPTPKLKLDMLLMEDDLTSVVPDPPPLSPPPEGSPSPTGGPPGPPAGPPGWGPPPPGPGPPPLPPEPGPGGFLPPPSPPFFPPPPLPRSMGGRSPKVFPLMPFFGDFPLFPFPWCLPGSSLSFPAPWTRKGKT